MGFEVVTRQQPTGHITHTQRAKERNRKKNNCEIKGDASHMSQSIPSTI